MKMYYLIIVVIFWGIMFFITSCNKSKDSKTEKIQNKIETKDNQYLGLRNMAFNITGEQIGFDSRKEKSKVYGVLMDWEVGNGTATLVAFISGDASLYLSSGGGIIGGQSHENVKTASDIFIKESEKFIDRASLAEKNPLPEKEEVIFYFLTSNGKFMIKERMENFENNTSALSQLFNDANKVINEIRISTEAKN